MNLQQEHAIECAYLDLVGAYQCHLAQQPHDWDAHNQSIEHLEAAFPDLLEIGEK